MPTRSPPTPPLPARTLYSRRTRLYDLMLRLLRYRQGLVRFFAGAEFLRPGLNVLDAGCGTGAATLALHAAPAGRGLLPARFTGFDLTPLMLRRFRKALDNHPIAGIELLIANVLQLQALPASWRNYDLVVSSAMLEYLPKADLPRALRGLGERLNSTGTLVVFISRQTPFMVPLIQQWWQANLYDKQELRAAFADAGFSQVDFQSFPSFYGYLNAWGHVVVARP
jgi:ubiquinone/menaquinone biosynthesis C-methylase UbiE